MKFLLVFLISTTSYCQSIDFFVINSFGQTFETSDAQLTSSVGEASIMRRLGLSELITDGFIQYRSNPSITTSIKDQSITDNNIAYPNPTMGLLYFNNEFNGSEYMLTDMRGSIVKSGKINASVDLSNLNQGIYTIIITTQSKTQTLKIVKQ